MRKAVRIEISLAGGIVSGIAVNLAFRAIMGYGAPRGPLIGYLIGTLPGLLFDPIQLIAELTVFLILYNSLPARTADNSPD
jgi:hypothetical protein